MKFALKKIATLALLSFLFQSQIYGQIYANDALFDEQWGLHNTGQTNGIDDVDIDAPEAWTKTKSCEGVTIGIIDNGFTWWHKDLGDNIWQNLAEDIDNDGSVLQFNEDKQIWEYDEDDIDGIDNDNNGYADDFIGWNFRNNSNDILGGNNHGTYCAGIIGAKNNEDGIAGICDEVKLAALIIFEENILGLAAEALNYAVNNGIKITNNSFGKYNPSNELSSAIELANQQGCLYITGTGNNGKDIDNNDNFYPASYTSPNIIAVANINHNGELSEYSNYGHISADLAAPGTDILTTRNNLETVLVSGTSFAVPHVAASAAMIWSLHPNKTHLEIKDAILNSVDLNPNLTNKCVTGGQLNLNKAVHYFDEQPCHQLEYLLLKNLYNHTDGENWINKWNLNQPMSSWYGVTLNLDGCVEKLELTQNNLNGVLPSDIGELTSLKSLRITHNKNLSGEIPKSISNLPILENLFLNGNSFTGSIPQNIGNLSQLQTLTLNGNDLSGTLPQSMNNLDQLNYVMLFNNNLSGCYPPILSSLCGSGSFSNLYISNGNNFDSNWDDFCSAGHGTCSEEIICTTISQTNFESGLDGWNCESSGCMRLQNSHFSNNSDYCIFLGDDTNISELTSTTFSSTESDYLTFSFSIIADRIEQRDNFILEVSGDNGNTWSLVKTWTNTIEIIDGIRTSETVNVHSPKSEFTKLRISSNINAIHDFYYFDDFIIQGCIDDYYVSPQEKLFDKNIEFKIYPNPIQKGNQLSIQINSVEKIDKVEIIDLAGKLIHQEKWNNEKLYNTIDINKFPSGSYILKVNSNENIKIEKFVILN